MKLFAVPLIEYSGGVFAAKAGPVVGQPAPPSPVKVGAPEKCKGVYAGSVPTAAEMTALEKPVNEVRFATAAETENWFAKGRAT